MIQKLKKIQFGATLVALLSGVSTTEAHSQSMSGPCRTEGLAFGLGVGVKFLSLKNITTKTTPGGVQTRTHDAFSNASSPVIGVYARKYLPNLFILPSFIGLDLEYLTQMDKKNIYGRLNNIGSFDTGYRYRERWDARAMFGAQLLNFTQIDIWGQAGLAITSYDYEGITLPTALVENRFRMDNHVALAPAGGLEARFSQPNLVANGVVTDFILGWTATYRRAFAHMANTGDGNTYNFAMNNNWSHTVGLKVMFRY